MIKSTNKIAISALIMSLFILIAFVPVVTARDAFAPSWLKEGTYVKYEAKTPSENSVAIGNFDNKALVGFFELSNPKFARTNHMLAQPVDLLLATEKCSVMWRCVNVNATMAKLKVTLDCIGESKGVEYSESKHLQRESEICVDLYTRAVYNVDGVFLGTTHLWLSANPKVDQKITIWEEGTETVTVPVKISGSQATALGQLTIFELDVATVTIKNNIKSLSSSYDLGTGLSVSTQYSMWDPIFASVGIQHGNIEISETNIDFELASSEINWTRILYYTIIPVAIILLIATLIIKRKKKKN